MGTRDATSWFGGLTYDIFLWIFTVVVDLFFREIHPRSTWRIPRDGPIIFVAAPHANQFIDPLLLMRAVRYDAKRRISFLIAAKSMTRKFIGFGARLVGAVPVGRALDMKKPAKGKIYLPDPEGDPSLVRGEGTQFTDPSFQVSGLLVLPSVKGAAANAEIQEIISDTEIRLKKPFKGDVALKQLAGKMGSPTDNQKSETETSRGTSFSVAPHIDQSAVYDAVFKRIRGGGCIGIFPEGGSHDRTELLPLKAGLAIMALGALAEDPDCGVSIVPVGMNYFHAHKFRSRAVIEFGTPVEIDPALVSQYKGGDRRGATAAVLDIVYNSLTAVTTLAPDYETLMLIQAVRRLYNPKGKRLPLPMVVELNRRLIKGYQTYKDDPRIVNLREAVLDYNRTLFRLNIRDHQVSYAKFSWYQVVGTLIYRLAKLLILGVAVWPGAVLFSPVFIAGKMISHRKSKEALAASTVKVRARDVVATWKVLVSLALAPTIFVTYSAVTTYWTYRNRIGGRVAEWIPLWLVFASSMIAFPALCFAALRFGEIGMDIFKSIRPLVLSINPTSSNTLVRLRARRQWLQDRVNELVNEFGPEMFPDFDHHRIVQDPHQSPTRNRNDARGKERPTTPSRHARIANENNVAASPEDKHDSRDTSAHLTRSDSFKNLGSIGIFATRPNTPTRSRSHSRGASHDFGGLLNGFSPISTKPNMDEVSKNLHDAMRERGRQRKNPDNASEYDRSGVATPSSDFEPEEAKKDI